MFLQSAAPGGRGVGGWGLIYKAAATGCSLIERRRKTHEPGVGCNQEHKYTLCVFAFFGSVAAQRLCIVGRGTVGSLTYDSADNL